MTSLSPAWLPLFRELGSLKRIHSADREGSIAGRLFVAGWSALIAGEPVADVMARVVSAALAAGRLGDLDLVKLKALGVEQRIAVLERGFDQLAGQLQPTLRSLLQEAIPAGAPDVNDTRPFVGKLARQPRAGVTCPGRARIILQPAETHAEHCLMVAVYAVIASPWYGAGPADVFLASMAHHLHNADMPDSGYSGEILLGADLDEVILRARDRALGEMPAALAGEVRGTLGLIAGDSTAEAQAFHVGDVLDRVLEIEQHFQIGQLTMQTVIADYQLVHDGPVKPLHDRILHEVGLA